MTKINKKQLFSNLIALVVMVVLGTVLVTNSSTHAAQATVDLGAASPFALLAGTPNITDAGNASVINGNVGLSPATGAGIGLFSSQVTGTIYSVDAAGPLPCRVTNGPLLVTAKNNLTAAYTDAANRIPVTTVPTELGGTTLVSVVYDSTSTTFGITAGAGALVLNGQNNPSSVFIFESGFSGTGLNVGSGSTVTLINGAQACNVFWRVDTANINTGATFVGTVLALNSISAASGATINGRLLARNGAISLINNTITTSICTGNDSANSSSAASSTTIPTFPNTGIFSGPNPAFIIAPASILVILTLLGLVARKKHLI